MLTKDIEKHLDDGTTEFAVFTGGYGLNDAQLGNEMLERATILQTGVSHVDQRSDPDVKAKYGRTVDNGIKVRYESRGGEVIHRYVTARHVFGTWEEHEVLSAERHERERRHAREREHRIDLAIEALKAAGVDFESINDWVREALGRLIEQDLEVTSSQPNVYSVQGYAYIHMLEADKVLPIDARLTPTSSQAQALYIHLHIRGVL